MSSLSKFEFIKVTGIIFYYLICITSSYNPSAFLRLSQFRSLWPLLVLYDFYFSSFICFGVKCDVHFHLTSTQFYLGGSWGPPLGVIFSRCVEDLLVAYGWSPFFIWVVVFYIFPISILMEFEIIIFVLNEKTNLTSVISVQYFLKTKSDKAHSWL